MYNDDAGSAGTIKKRFTDPEQIILVLLRQGPPRTEAGVDEDETREFEADGQLAQPLEVRSRHPCFERHRRRRGPYHAISRIDAVGRQGLQPPIGKPIGVAARRSKKVEQHLLVVAGQREAAKTIWRWRKQVVNHPRRLGPSVDIIAEQHDPLLAFDRSGIGSNQLLELAQLVEAAMHVADRVDDGRADVSTQPLPAPRMRRLAVAKQGSHGAHHEWAFRLLILAAVPTPSRITNRMVLA